MCEAGRIRHHLKHNLWGKECTILFVGYQAVGTLGRKLVESKPESVRLFGENVEVNARIEVLAGISGHADMNGLLNWIDGFKEKPSHILLYMERIRLQILRCCHHRPFRHSGICTILRRLC